MCADKVFKNVVDLEPRKIDAKLGEHYGTKVPYQIHLPYMHICFFALVRTSVLSDAQFLQFCWEGFHTNQISIDVAIVVAAVVAVVGAVAVLVVFVVVVVFVYNTHRFCLCCNGLAK